MQTKHISACLMGNSGASSPRKDGIPYDSFILMIHSYSLTLYHGQVDPETVLGILVLDR